MSMFLLVNLFLVFFWEFISENKNVLKEVSKPDLDHVEGLKNIFFYIGFLYL